MSKNDIRLAVGMVDHPKTAKLIRRCGEDSFRCLLRLWCWARENRPDGILSNMDDDDIEIAAGWSGEIGAFIIGLRHGWLDGEQLHDWDEHQGWACGAKARSDRAKKAAKAKWDKRDVCLSNAQADSEQSLGSAPSPSPSPKPKNNTPYRDEDREGDILIVFGYWREHAKGLPMPQTFKGKRKSTFKTRIKEHPDLNDWENAIKKLGASPFHNGDNDRKWKADFDFLLRPGKLAEWVEKEVEQPDTDNSGNWEYTQ